ncbi:RING-type E3 ubiquitin transferase [Ranunculus cassubicifolius]
MAVQAQYPSNVFLLNRNDDQDMKNNNLLNNQSQMYFNNNNKAGEGGNINPRKRGRETSYGVDLFSLQPQQPHHTTVINLSDLHNQQQQQPKLVSTGLRLSTHHHHQQQQQEKQSTLLSEDITVQLQQHRDEIDQFLQLQGDQLRRTLAERRQTHYHALLTAISESQTTKRLREKEGEMQKALRRNAELEQRAAQLRVEAQVWQNKARKHESIAAALQVQLQQAMMSLGAQNNNREEECSGAEDAESAHVDPEREKESDRPSCKACRKSVACVVLLPCRHLCVCTKCNSEVDTCPVCFAYRSASVEVYLS